MRHTKKPVDLMLAINGLFYWGEKKRKYHWSIFREYNYYIKKFMKCEICNKKNAVIVIKGDCGICNLEVCQKCRKLDIAKDIYGWNWNLRTGQHNYFNSPVPKINK